LQDFSSVAEKTGTYTAMDYADIMEHLVKRWRVAERDDLTGEVSSVATSVLQEVLQQQQGNVACSSVCLFGELVGSALRTDRGSENNEREGTVPAVMLSLYSR
jgi:hypothetical protein